MAEYLKLWNTLSRELASSPLFMFVLAFLVLAIGYFAKDRVSRLLFHFLRMLPLGSQVRKLKAQSFYHEFREKFLSVIRAVLFGVTALLAMEILTASPELSYYILIGWDVVVWLTQTTVATVIYDVALITLSGFLLYKTSNITELGIDGIKHWVVNNKGTKIRGLFIQNSEIISQKKVLFFLIRVLNLLTVSVKIGLVLAFFAAMFTIVPQTRATVFVVLHELLDVFWTAGNGIISYFPNLLSLFVIIVISAITLKLLRFFFLSIEDQTLAFPNFPPDWAIPTYQVIRFIVFAMAMVVAFPYLPGSSSPAFQGVSVFVGVLLSLGSTSFISNIVAGVVLTYTNAFKVGDRVKISDTTGDVTGKSLLVTRIRTIKNVDISVPNGMVLSSHIMNFSSNSDSNPLILNTTITLGYDTPWRLVHETLIAAAKATNGISQERVPFVLQTALDDFYVRYELNAYTSHPAQMARIYSDLHQNIQDYCKQAGVEIMSPHYRAVRDGNQTTIPKD